MTAHGGDDLSERGCEAVVLPSQVSTVLVEGVVGPTAEDAGDSGCIPGDMTVEQYQDVYRRWAAGELGDVQAQHGTGVLELVQNQYAVIQSVEEDTAQLLAGGETLVMPGQGQHTEMANGRHDLE